MISSPPARLDPAPRHRVPLALIVLIALLGIAALAALIAIAPAARADPAFIVLSAPSPGQAGTVASGNVSFSFIVTHNTSGVRCILTLDGAPAPLSSAGTDVANGATVSHSALLAPGSHVWQAACADGGGQGPAQGSTPAIAFQAMDLATPAITLISPQDDAALSGPPSGQDVTFGFSVADESGISNCTLEVDGTVRALITAPLPGTHQRTLTLAEGGHAWQVRCADNSSLSNQGASAMRQLVVDLTAPAVSVLAPSLWHNTTLETTVFNVTAGDTPLVPGFPVPQTLACELSIDGTVASSFTLAPENSSAGSHRTAALLPPGNHSYQARCSDAAGNNGSSLTGKVTRYDFGLGDLLLQAGTDKASYLAGEPLDILVNATPGSAVTVTLTRSGSLIYNYTYAAGPGISPPGVFLSTGGIYTLAATARFLEVEKSASAQFTVMNSTEDLLCSISAQEVGRVGAAHAFSGTAYNAFGTVSYSWDFTGDNVTDAAGQNRTYAFSSAGVHAVRLTVQDSVESATCSLTVQMDRVFTLTATVVDNITGGVLRMATVETEGSSASTGMDGITYLTLAEGTHFLLVSKAGFIPYYQSQEISANTSKVFRLHPRSDDDDAPLISVTAPGEGSEVGGSSVELAFAVRDASAVECALYFSPYAGWWGIEDSSIAISPEGGGAAPVSHTHTLPAANLSDGTYYWKVSCEDTAGNGADSGNLSFVYRKGAEAPTGTADIVAAARPGGAALTGVARVRDMIRRIETAIDGMRSLDPQAEEVAGALGIQAGLDSQKTTMIRIRNEYFGGISSPSGTESEADLARFESDFKEDIGLIELDTIVSADVNLHEEFVRYEFPEDIRGILKDYFSYSGADKSDAELDSLVDAVNDLQAEVVITTDVHVAEVAYLSGARKNITLVIRSLEFKNDSLVTPASIFLERLPKSVVESSGELVFLGNYQVLNDDPLVRLYPTAENALVYYIDRAVAIEDVQAISTLVLDEGALGSSGGRGGKGATGLAVGAFLGSRNGRLGLLVGAISLVVLGLVLTQMGLIRADLVAGVLRMPQLPFLRRDGAWSRESTGSSAGPRAGRSAGIGQSAGLAHPASLAYLAGPAGSAGHADARPSPRTSGRQALREIDALVAEVDTSLERRDHARAKDLFRELRLYDGAVPEEHMREFRAMLTEFSTRLNLAWGERLLAEAFESASMGDRAAARAAYGKLAMVYPHLGVEAKASLLPKTNALLARLASLDMADALSGVEQALAASDRERAARSYGAARSLYPRLSADEKKRVFQRIAALRARMAM